jgi:hypothetical protein
MVFGRHASTHPKRKEILSRITWVRRSEQLRCTTNAHKYVIGPMLEDTYPGINIIMLDDDKEHLLRWTKVVLSDPAASK